ncbi:MAG: homoserine kinase [Bacteroidetes bacterium]|nr:homoserine kinase [Bacteroidota bacterium]MBP6401596.1 homoserine kinase [Bacteroidia bacterium]MBP6648115.1 homoserine kinase [Bacteroidia bacterium]
MAIKKNKSVRVFAPATVANLACGFDVMGLAIDEPGDFIEITKNDRSEIRIVKMTGDGGKLSRDADKNTASVSVAAMMRYMESTQGFDIVLKKNMPLGSGLGSSAASSAAAVVAANELLGRPFDRESLVHFAMEGERVACGSAHADNVAPCILGGIVLIRSYDPLEIISLPVPNQLYVVVVHPHVEVLTRVARAVLPKEISLKTGITQWANTAAFVAGLYQSDYSLISRSVEDHVAEPARADLIPHFYTVQEAALLKGALACSISGSGPSVFALTKGAKQAALVAAEMKKVFRQHKTKCDVFVSAVNKKGVRILPS